MSTPGAISRYDGYGKEVLKVKNGKKVESFQLRRNPIPSNEPVGINRIIAQSPRLIVEFRQGFQCSYWQLQGEQFVPFPPEHYSPGEISGILQWQEDYICFINQEELLIQDRSGKNLARFTKPGHAGAGDELLYTFVDRQNFLWAATGNGLLRISRRENPFDTFQVGNSIRGICRDGRWLYIGGYGGNVRMDLQTGEEQTILQPEDVAMSFFKGDGGRLWAGGINSRFSEYTSTQDTWITNRLAPPDISWLTPFQNSVTGRVWIGTIEGLARLDEEKKEAVFSQ